MSARREVAVVVLACAALYLTGSADIPFYTRGEPREGLVVREMLRTGDWLVPGRPDGEPIRKPPLYYWAAAGVARLLPARPELALRLPSAALATFGALATYGAARRAFGAAAGLPAALVLATAFEWVRAGTSARVDMTLAATLAVLLALWTDALARGRTAAALPATVAAALGTLAKGPVALVLPALAAAGLAIVRGDAGMLRRLRIGTVLGLAAAAAAAWYGIAIAREGTQFLGVVARENVLRFVDTEDAGTGHAHGLGYLVPLGLVGLLPWVPLLPLAAAGARRAPRDASGLAAAWALAGIGFFSLAAAKRSVYLLPCFPALAVLVGAGVAAPGGARAERWARALSALYVPATLLLAATGAALALGLDPGAPFARWLREDDAAGAAVVARVARESAAVLLAAALGTVLGTIAIARARRRGDWRRLVLVVAALAVAWTATFDARLHPAIARARSHAAFLARVDALVPPDAPLYAVFPPDPGVRFYAPRPLRRWPPPADGAPHPSLLWEDEWRRLPHAPAPLATGDVRSGSHGRLLLVPAVAPVRTGSRSP